MGSFNKKNNKLLLVLLFCFSSYFTIFHNLGKQSIKAWDESLFAYRAYFFAEYNTTLKNFNQIDENANFFNTKPAFITIIQAFFIKTFGFNETALRLPIAISFFLMCLFLIYSSLKVFDNIFIGFIAAFILLGSPGMYVDHMARSGDHDVAFTFIFILLVYNSYRYLEDYKIINLISCVILLTMGYYTKSVSVLLVFPGIFIYLLYTKKLKTVLKKKTPYFLFGLLLVGIYFSFSNDINHLGNYKRLFSSNGHNEKIYYYIRHFIKEYQFLPWAFFLPVSLVYFKENKFLQFLVFQSISIFVILTLAQTKLYWYSAPLYPVMSILVAFTIYKLFKKYKETFLVLSLPMKTIFSIVMIAVFFFPFYNVLALNNFSQNHKNDNIGIALNGLKKNLPEIRNMVVLKDYEEGYLPQINYYIMLFNNKFEYNILRKFNVSHCEEGENVLCTDYYHIDVLNERFKLDTLYQYETCYLVNLKKELKK